MKNLRIFVSAIITIAFILSNASIMYAESTTVTYGGTKIVKTDSLSEGRAVAVDGVGNVYIVGTASDIDGAINFNPSGSDIKAISYGMDIFLTKWNADGSYGWSKVIGGGGNNAAMDVAVDSAGNVIVVGSFSEANLNFNPAGSDSHSTVGSDDVFVSKWSAAGIHQWTKTFGGTSSDVAQSVAVDTADNVYVAGSFRGTVNFNQGGTDNHASGGASTNSFITKFSPNGSYVWTKTFSSSSANEINAVASNGTSVFVAGTFRDSTDFDPNTGTQLKSPVGSGDIFLTSLDISGNYRWVKTFGGSNFEEGLGVASQGDNVYVSGYIASTNVNFNQDGSDVKSVNGVDNAFVTKFDGNGNYGWTKLIGNNSAAAYDVIADGSGDVYLTGYFSGTDTNFNPSDSDLRSTAPTDQDIFITRYNADGTYGWTKATSGGDFNYSYGIAVGPDNTVHAVGQLYSDASGTNFNQDGNDKFGDGSTFDIFYTKWNQAIEQFITNPPAGIIVIDKDGNNLVLDGAPQAAAVAVQLRDSTTAIPIVEVQLNLSSDVDWSGVSIGSDETSGKAFVSGLNTSTGSVGTHTLYIPKLSGQNMVTICPHAKTLAEVTTTCLDAVQYSESDQNVTTKNIDGKQYWVVSGLTGTGGVGGVLGVSAVPAAFTTTAEEPNTSNSLANTGIKLLSITSIGFVLVTVAIITYRARSYRYSYRR